MDTGDEIMDSKVIAIAYLKGKFTIDLLSTIPFDTFADLASLDIKILQLFGLLKLIRILRLSKIITFMRIKKDFKLYLKFV
mmetsp:Transcript_15567/g.2593  ORF Transcript_15567/g.2593 Transcript_15567/m.2593 type:complete len:81 (+) Transcript_15567:320-562(+)